MSGYYPRELWQIVNFETFKQGSPGVSTFHKEAPDATVHLFKVHNHVKSHLGNNLAYPRVVLDLDKMRMFYSHSLINFYYQRAIICVAVSVYASCSIYVFFTIHETRCTGGHELVFQPNGDFIF